MKGSAQLNQPLSSLLSSAHHSVRVYMAHIVHDKIHVYTCSSDYWKTAKLYCFKSLLSLCIASLYLTGHEVLNHSLYMCRSLS